MFAEKAPPKLFDRPLMRAILYSSLLHLILLLAFKIRPATPDSAISSTSSTVLLEEEENVSALFISHQQEDACSSLYRSLHIPEPRPLVIAIHDDQELADHITGIPLKIPFITPWENIVQKASEHISHVYPMKILLHNNLSEIPLSNDGSSIFIPATQETIFFTPKFAEVHPKIEVTIVIDTASGRIISSTCAKEFVDKRLQWLADIVIKKLRFRVSSLKPTISGSISIQFAGTFETLHQLIAWGHLHD